MAASEYGEAADAVERSRAPGGELVSSQGFGDDDTPRRVHGVDLNRALGQIDSDSDNLVHGLPLSQACRLSIHTINLGASTP